MDCLLNPTLFFLKPQPPKYRLDTVKVPVALYWGPNDWFVPPVDMKHLKSDLPNVVRFYRVPDDKFTHVDFAWGSNATDILYKPVIQLMDRYRN